ncbi:MAG: nucleotide exchange factor GrpE [Solirubrobacterales bacterium]
MSGRRPAGAPEDWEERLPAGSAHQGRGTGHPPADAGSGRAETTDEGLAPAEHPAGDVPSPARRFGEPDEGAAETPDEEGSDVVEDLDALLSDVKRERDEYLELAQRAKADFENFRKRASRDATDAEKRGKASLARELVPAIDNLERALRAAGIDPDAGAPTGEDAEPRSEEVSPAEAFARGVALVLGELRATLERAGVEAYDPAGERFDPAWHEALSTRADEEAESGRVIETLERGYRLDGQVLRPARVVVSE